MTFFEAVRFVVYRLTALYYRVLRRLLRGDRLTWGSERKFQGLLESAPDAMVIVNRHGHIELVNGQAERMFGYARHEIIGQAIGVLIPRRLRAVHGEHVRNYMRHASARPMGSGLELFGLHKDGSEFPVEISLSPLDTDQGVLVSAAIRDISERQRAVADLRAAEELFRGAFEESPIGIALADAGGTVVRANAALCDLVGRPPADIVGRRLHALLHPAHAARDGAALDELTAGEVGRLSAETRLLHGGGHGVWVALQATAIRPGALAPTRALVQIQDITERKRFEDDLRFVAEHDPLTGLENRGRFVRRLEEHAELARRYGPEGAVLLLDLDHFKYVNDTVGHHAGDHMIVQVAAVLSERLRESDVLARIGGDEFAVLLPKADAAAARRVADDLLQALRVARIPVPRTRDRTITASIGVAVLDGAQTTGEDILIGADLAMYDAKEEGRNRVSVFDGEGHGRSPMRGRITWAERIAVAIDEGRFTLVAQPIVDLSVGRATQFEALLRMRDEHGDLIAPGAFLYVAERLGMIQQIDAMAVSTAIRALAHPDAAGCDARVEINLSAASIGDPALIELIERELRETGLDPNRVIFEITETAAIANITRARAFTERVERLGCRFALDDFGSGFGSFYYLKHINYDYLKIDGEFVRDCCATLADRLIIQAVVGIARGLGKQTIAEHVGDEQTVALLRELGVDYGQGFHLARSEPLEQYVTRPPDTLWLPRADAAPAAAR